MVTCYWFTNSFEKNDYGFGAGDLQAMQRKVKGLLHWNEWIFSVTILNRQDIDGHLPQMRCLQTKRLKSGIWGHRSFGEGLSWEESSEGLLTCSTAPLAEGDPVFLSLRKKQGRYFLLCLTWGTIPKIWPTKNRAKVALSHLHSCSDSGLDTGQWISVQIRAARGDSSDLH